MSDTEKRKVGIMGGTFDPIHIGHLILGENAYMQFQLDKVWFMPSGNPPHKVTRQGGASNDERIEMVQRAIEGNPHFALSLDEMHENGYTYTRETLKRLCKEHPDQEYYFIMGADSMFSFDHWKEPQEICRLCTLVVAVRDHVDQTQFDEQILYLKNKYQAKIEKLQTPNIDISSRMIRQWFADERTCKYYVPDSVISYIEENQIYSNK